MAKRGGLGSGLDALIPKSNKSGNSSKGKKSGTTGSSNSTASAVEKKKAGDISTESAAGRGAVQVDINRVEPNREQPRKQFDPEALKELSDSIQKYGVLQPLLVSDEKDYYRIIAGERRWRAAKEAGLKQIPVIIKELSDQESMEISLIENLQREDLNPIEEAQAYKKLTEEFHLTQNEVAQRVSKSRTAVTNSMRLLKLDPKVQELVLQDKLSMGHARALLGLEDPNLQVQAAEQIIEKNLSVREVEKMIQSMLHPRNVRKTEITPEQKYFYENLENQMKDVLGTKVEIKNRGEKGKIEISYYSAEELDHLLQMIQSIDRNI